MEDAVQSPDTSDDAGGNERGWRATASVQLLDAVARVYGIEVADHQIDLGGSSNLNLRVDYGSEHFVVRVYRPHVTLLRLEAIHRVRHELARTGVPCDDLVTTVDGRPWMSFGNRLVEVERFVGHDAGMNRWERLKVGMPVLGRIHSTLWNLSDAEAAKSPKFVNYVSASEALDRTLMGTNRIRRWRDTSAVELELANDADELARHLRDAERPFIGHIPVCLAHGDYWDNNVLFRANKLVWVTDFDYMGERPRIDDLALTLYFTALELASDPISDRQLEQLRSLLDAYETGADVPLSEKERAALPLAIARQPLWSLGGWVASLDDEETARRHAASTAPEVRFALALTRDLERWKAAFA